MERMQHVESRVMSVIVLCLTLLVFLSRYVPD